MSEDPLTVFPAVRPDAPVPTLLTRRPGQPR
jgi:hypothetical protein